LIFHLQKQYFDGIDSNGNTFILYYAQLKLLNIPIHYSSKIIASESYLSEKSTLRKTIVPRENRQFQNDRLNCKLTYQNQKDFPPIEEILWEEKDKYIKWKVFLPHAIFQFTNEDETWKGLGYSETLELNFVPWKLPISTLKWGRFLSENHSVIWVEWLGKFPLQKVYVNGQILNEKTIITESGIQIPTEDISIQFLNPESLKNEKLQKIANRYPFLNLFFYKRFLESKEMKFKSKSIIQTQNSTENGYSLYEIVEWKK
jgi:hypothetical protein